MIESWMEYFTGPSGPPPSEEVLKWIKACCEAE